MRTSAAPALTIAATASRIVSPVSHVSSTISTRLLRTVGGAALNTAGVSRTVSAPKRRLTIIEWNSRPRMAAITAPGTTPAVAMPIDDLGIVGPRDLEREPARELAEERPLDLEYALGMLDCRAAW